MEILQSRLREVREERRFSQSMLGSLAGCGQEKISFYETGKSKPQYQTLVRLADALQVSIDYLLGRTDTMSPKMSLEDVLEKDEIDLILKYRELPKEKQAKLSGIAIGLSG